MNDIESAITIANLTNDNIIVLNYLEKNIEKKESILKELYNGGNISNIDYPLINQSVYISSGYISFVWLYEIFAKKQGLEKSIQDFVKELNIFKDTNKNLLQGKERNTSNPKEFLRTLRNAISHGNLKIDFENVCFIFEDQNPKKGKEKDAAKLKLPMISFGELSSKLLYFYNDIAKKTMAYD